MRSAASREAIGGDGVAVRSLDMDSAIKRLFDLTAALFGLMILWPLFGVVAVLIKLDSPGPVFFCQQRIGRRFRSFRIYKFRTMVQDAPQRGPSVTTGSDPRVTGVGRTLRRWKIDEVPQLLNVLKGDMSLVGPRPEVDEYVQLFREDFRNILSVRPGITDLASLFYPDEERVLAATDSPDEAYRQVILPRKIQLARESIRRSSFFFDVSLIVRTLLSVFVRRRATPCADDSSTLPSRPVSHGPHQL